MKTYIVSYVKKYNRRERYGKPFVTCSLDCAIEQKKYNESIMTKEAKLCWEVEILMYDLKTQGKLFHSVAEGKEIKEPF